MPSIICPHANVRRAGGGTQSISISVDESRRLVECPSSPACPLCPHSSCLYALSCGQADREGAVA